MIAVRPPEVKLSGTLVSYEQGFSSKYSAASFRNQKLGEGALGMFDSKLGGEAFDESQSLSCQVVARWSQVTPDAGGASKLGLRLRERFDGQPAVVIEVFEGEQDAPPIDMSAPGNSAVVLGNVDVAQPCTNSS